MQDVHKNYIIISTYLMGFANTYLGLSVSSCMDNQETHEVAEYNLLHVHMYNIIYSIDMHVCSILYVLELAHMLMPLQ